MDNYNDTTKNNNGVYDKVSDYTSDHTSGIVNKFLDYTNGPVNNNKGGAFSFKGLQKKAMEGAMNMAKKRGLDPNKLAGMAGKDPSEMTAMAQGMTDGAAAPAEAPAEAAAEAAAAPAEAAAAPAEAADGADGADTNSMLSSLPGFGGPSGGENIKSTPEYIKSSVKKITDELCQQLQQSSDKIGQNIETHILNSINWEDYGKHLASLSIKQINSRFENLQLVLTNVNGDAPAPPTGSVSTPGSDSSSSTNNASSNNNASSSDGQSGNTYLPTMNTEEVNEKLKEIEAEATEVNPEEGNIGSSVPKDSVPEEEKEELNKQIKQAEGEIEQLMPKGLQESSFINTTIEFLDGIDVDSNDMNKKGEEYANKILELYKSIDDDLSIKKKILDLSVITTLEGYKEATEALIEKINEKLPNDKKQNEEQTEENQNPNEEQTGEPNGEPNEEPNKEPNEEPTGNNETPTGNNETPTGNNETPTEGEQTERNGEQPEGPSDEKPPEEPTDEESTGNEEPKGKETEKDITKGQHFMEGFLNQIEKENPQIVTKIASIIKDMLGYLLTEEKITEINEKNAKTSFGRDLFKPEQKDLDKLNNLDIDNIDDKYKENVKNVLNKKESKTNVDALIKFMSKFKEDNTYFKGDLDGNSINSSIRLYKEEYDKKQEKDELMDKLFEIFNNLYVKYEVDKDYYIFYNKEKSSDPKTDILIHINQRRNTTSKLKDTAKYAAASAVESTVNFLKFANPVNIFKKIAQIDTHIDLVTGVNPWTWDKYKDVLYKTPLYKEIFEFLNEDCNGDYAEGLSKLYELYSLRSGALNAAKSAASSAASAVGSLFNKGNKEPTGEPTEEPTGEPTGEPTEEPTEGKKKNVDMKSRFRSMFGSRDDPNKGGKLNNTKRIKYISNNKTRRNFA
jgi:hypothetical protein